MIKSDTSSSNEKSSNSDAINPNPTYYKPKTSLFLEKAADVKSGADNILESDGDGFLDS